MTIRRSVLALATSLVVVSTPACSFTGTASAGRTSPSASATASAETSTTTTTTTASPSRSASRTGSSTSAPHASPPHASPPGTGSTGTGSTSGGGTGVPRCALGRLRVAATDLEGAAGSIYSTITLRNTGAVCRLLGRPGVDGIRADGRVVHATRTGTSSSGSSTPSPVVLKQGGHASFTLRAQNVPSGTATSCPPRFTALLVTPPDLQTSAHVAVDLPACGPLSVGPIVAGIQG